MRNEKATPLGRKYALLTPKDQREVRSDAEKFGIPNSTFYRLIDSEQVMESFKRFVVACSLIGLTAKDLHDHLKNGYEQLPEAEKAKVQCLEEFLGEDIATVGFAAPFEIPKGFRKRKY